jgi:hypothetical protein
MIDSRSKAGCIVQEDVVTNWDRVSSKKCRVLKGGFTPSPNSFSWSLSRTFVSGARSEGVFLCVFECVILC